MMLSYKKLKPWLICIAASFYFFYAFANFNLTNSLSPYLLHDWKITTLQYSFLSSVYLYAIALFFIPTGFLLDRYSSRILMLLGMAIAVITSLLFIIAGSFETAIALRFILGAVHALGFLGSIRIATAWLPNNKALAVGIVISIGLLGGLIVQGPFETLIVHIGWQYTLLTFSLLGCFLWLMMFFILEDLSDPATSAIAFDFGQWFSQFKQTVKQLQNWFCAAYTCLLNLPIIILGALWGNQYLASEKHFSYLDSSYVITALYLGMLLGSPLIGFLSDRYKNRKILMMIGSICALAVLINIYFFKHGNFYQIAFLFLLLGFFISSQNLSYAIISEINPTTRTSTALGLASIIIMGGGALFQTLFTWITNVSSSLTYQNAFLVLPLSAIASLAFVLFIMI